jgi:hypothetical protein
LEDLGPQLEQLGALSEIFDWSPELSNIVMKFYRDILIVLETAVETYSQSGKINRVLSTWSNIVNVMNRS